MGAGFDGKETLYLSVPGEGLPAFDFLNLNL